MHNVDGSSMLTDRVDIFKQYVDFVKKKKINKKNKNPNSDKQSLLFAARSRPRFHYQTYQAIK